jgi:hypothetical protein
MKSRRFAAILLLVVALTLSVVTVASAHAGSKSKATFDASAPVDVVGPGPEFSTSIKVKMQGHGEDPHIDRITMKTVDEAVVAGPTLVDLAGFEESGEAGACVVTAAILNGTAIVSLHDSKAILRNVVEIPTIIPGFKPEWGFKGYTGTLDGKLKGDFSIDGGLLLVGTAKLDIL